MLLNHFHDRLQYLQPTVWALVDSAGSVEQLRRIDWLSECHRAMEDGIPFPQAWRGALTRDCGALGEEEAALLAALADTLGATDLQSQLTALAYTRSQLEGRLALAREYREKHRRLYNALGALSGAAVMIILL